MIFHGGILIAKDGTALPMRFVESMKYPTGEDHTVAKLKDDLEIEIVMCSGKEYTISTRKQFEGTFLDIEREGIVDARTAIFDKWKFVITGKQI